MPLWILVPLLAFVATIQITLLTPLPLVGVKPELALMLVVTWAMLAPLGEAAVWGFILGVFLDLASGMPFGMHTLVLTLLGWLIGWAQTTFFRGNLLAPPLAMLLATFAYHVVLLALLSLFNTPIDWLAYLGRVTLPAALVHTLGLPLLYFPLQRLARWRYPQMQVSADM
jgi:rod shape-determining protein MreD